MDTICNIISKTILLFISPIVYVTSFCYHFAKTIFSSND